MVTGAGWSAANGAALYTEANHGENAGVWPAEGPQADANAFARDVNACNQAPKQGFFTFAFSNGGACHEVALAVARAIKAGEDNTAISNRLRQLNNWSSKQRVIEHTAYELAGTSASGVVSAIRNIRSPGSLEQLKKSVLQRLHAGVGGSDELKAGLTELHRHLDEHQKQCLTGVMRIIAWRWSPPKPSDS